MSQILNHFLGVLRLTSTRLSSETNREKYKGFRDRLSKYRVRHNKKLSNEY